MRRTRALPAAGPAAALLALALLAGCAAGEPAAEEATPAPSATADEPSDEPTDEATEDPTDAASDETTEEESEKPLPQGPFADLAFDGDSVSPNGERMELGVGERLTLRIDSDRPGELHVHSTPEQVISFPAGQSERRLRIQQPGVVDVEEHDSGRILLQLEVR